ncbi:AI-2E family transporter [Iodidimonas gelatinilytica]|uniref:AI-2E family transporter n=1 Tax=Iodidimonas gelatinilytica TaxID=1236966 RepID=A0A5A7N0E6_9PROT|nr:AI-2E family transporter [Iodidimonas gelatinilytica]GER00669.1 AI-2E family transporter [Iodidimonas gelatinilytica]
MKQANPISRPGRLFYSRTVALLTILVLSYLSYLITAPFLSPLAWAAILAFLLHPLYVRLAAKIGARRNFAALAITLLTTIFLIGPLSILLASFASQAAELMAALQKSNTENPESLVFWLHSTSPIAPLIDRFQTSFDISFQDMDRWAAEGIQKGLEGLISFSGKVFIGALGTITSFSIMLFMLFFILRDGSVMLGYSKALVPLSDERTDQLFNRIADVIYAVVFGTIVTALIQGALTGLALAVVGIPAPVVFGVLAAIFSLLPIGGTAIVWLPACLYLLASNQWGAAIGLGLWGMLLVGTIDNFLRPLLVSSRGHVGTLLVFIGVLGGITAFGMVGLLLGPVILALSIALLRFTREQREAESQPLPPSS